MTVITLTTDFGEIYLAEMKGVILKINPHAAIVEISRKIPRHSISAGAFALLSTAKHFPEDTVHVGVVDPEVGTSRISIVIKSVSGQHFIGPDNGLLIPAARSLGSFKVYEIPENKKTSYTFHGRDIFAPLAARISKGYEVDEFRRVRSYREIDFEKPKTGGGKVEGRVLHIDEFGNVITNIPEKIFKAKPGGKLKFKKQLITFARTYADVEENKHLMLIGSHGFLEIAANRASASNIFSLKVGDRVKIILRK